MRVTLNGKLTYLRRYRYDGSAKFLDLDTYPLLPPEEALLKAQRLKTQLEQGHDSKIVRRPEM